MSSELATKKKSSLRGKTNDQRFHRYIKIAWKGVSDRIKIDSVVVDQLNFILNRVACYVAQKVRQRDVKTIREPDVKKIISILVEQNYLSKIVKQAESSHKKLVSHKGQERKNLSEVAGLNISLARVSKILKKNGRTSLGATVMLTSFLHVLLEDMLDLGKLSMRGRKNVLFKSQFLYRSIFSEDASGNVPANIKSILCKLNIQILASGIDTALNADLHKTEKHTKTTRSNTDEHRWRAGTKANMQIKRLEKQGGYKMSTPKTPLYKLMKLYLNSLSGGKDMRVSENAVVILRMYIENFARDLLRKSNNIARHAGRIGLSEQDIAFVVRERDGACL
jgi:histone H3/H4